MRLYTHPACLTHFAGPAHPEAPARLRAILEALDCDQFCALDRVEAPCASLEQLSRVHDGAYIERILDTCPADGAICQLDEDTFMSTGSAEAALRAAGAGVAAVDAVLSGAIDRAFCAIRPPGHHATRDRAMGFCLFNNVAVAAAHALAAHGLKRVAIADFDVHHGNGTQAIFAAEPRVLYASSHQMPLYPDTGAAAETGCGNIVNAPLPTGTRSHDFRATWYDVLLPRIAAFRPQLLLVSAGFDAHRLDPLADVLLEDDDYTWISERLVELARAHCGGRLVSCLEGGYDLTALRAGVRAHVAALMDA
ncbi:MAG TPA: histone deacetylase family protein [Rhodanobacteraceae bacterium]